jgi:ATP-dependent Clp protease ATP-binding subunit ClpA
MAFERFTGKARRVVVLAQEEARGFNHNYIGTEHLLLGLLGVPDSRAGQVLTKLGYTRDNVRAGVDEVVGQGGATPRGHIPFTPRAKQTLDLALRESLQLHHHHIGTEHILLALITEGSGVGAQLLAARVDPISGVRTAVLDALADAPDTPNAPGGAAPARTPAAEDAVTAAAALAGGAPVGSHHLLEAVLRTDNSMAAQVLRALGVDPDAVAAKIDELDPESTTDANPEESAARRMELRLDGDEVHLVLRDAATVAAARAVAGLADGPITGAGPVAGLFVPLWRATGDLLRQLRQAQEPEPAGESGGGAARVVRAALAPRLRRRKRG